MIKLIEIRCLLISVILKQTIDYLNNIIEEILLMTKSRRKTYH